MDLDDGLLSNDKLMSIISQNDLKNFENYDSMKIVYKQKNEKYKDVTQLVVEAEASM